MDTRWEYMFSSLVKQKMKGENCAVFCFAGNFFIIYDVIVKQKNYKRSTNHYSRTGLWHGMTMSRVYTPTWERRSRIYLSVVEITDAWAKCDKTAPTPLLE